MKKFTNVTELAEGCPELLDYFKYYHDGELVDGFANYFGGDVFVIETAEDLDKIETSTGQSIREAPQSFDGCNEMLDGTYTEFFLCTNNAGGNSYYVPKAIVDENPCVAACVKATELFWSRIEDNQKIDIVGRDANT